MVLTKSELEIMDVLWDAGTPLSRSDLLERSDEKNWKDSSVHILLNGLLQKGAICEAGYVKRSKTYGRTFCPLLTREEYYAAMVFSFRRKPQLVGLVAAMMKRPDITAEERQQILEIVSSDNA
jgi:predicted transcriptional regulator